MGTLSGVRSALRGQVVASLGGELDAQKVAEGVDQGWFGPQSVAWKIHQDACLLIGGVSALFTQTLHPLAMAGVADHSSYTNDPWGRLHRTSMFLAEVVYGDSVTAERNVVKVTKIHEKVVGTTPDGRSYRASDPRLLTYVHATEVAGFLRSYQRYGAQTLSDDEADEYVREMSVVARKLGAEEVPQDVAQLEAYLRGVRAELALGEQGARAVSFLKNPPGGVLVQVGYKLIRDGACALIEEPEALMLGVERERRRGEVLNSGKLAATILREILGESPVVTAAKKREGVQ
jgi:uncharacterized protein (DUF2236 family)